MMALAAFNSVLKQRNAFTNCRLCWNCLTNKSYSTGTSDITKVKEENGIRRITLNNVKKRNALSLEMLQTLKRNITDNIDDESLRVIIIDANGPVFSSGHDLKELATNTKRSFHSEVFSLCSEVMELVQDIPVPIICEVEGLATAAGCQLVASCDIAIASEKASFCTPGVNIGLFCSTPAVALGRSVPRKLALEMLFTGDIISAQRAEQHGLVSKVVPEGQVQDETMKVAQKIIKSSRSVITMGKYSFYRQIVKDRSAAYKDATNVMVQNLHMHDGREGVSAFTEKRTPKWNHKFEVD